MTPPAKSTRQDAKAVIEAWAYISNGHPICVALSPEELQRHTVRIEGKQGDYLVRLTTPPLAPDSDTERILAEAAQVSRADALVMVDRLCAKVRELQAELAEANEVARLAQALRHAESAHQPAKDSQ